MLSPRNDSLDVDEVLEILLYCSKVLHAGVLKSDLQGSSGRTVPDLHVDVSEVVLGLPRRTMHQFHPTSITINHELDKAAVSNNNL